MSVDERAEGQPPPPARPRRRRRALRLVAWLLAVAAWVAVCFTWLFPLLTELGLDPTLGG